MEMKMVREMRTEMEMVEMEEDERKHLLPCKMKKIGGFK